MIVSEFQNIRIAGISAAVPTRRVEAHEYDELFGKDMVDKNIASTGVQATYHALREQTSSDFAYVAARHLMEELNIDPDSIGILLFTATYLDYIVPPTACVLQKRLGLSQDCIAYDINLACSGYVYGLQSACALLNSSSAQRALLLTGDITSKTVSTQDKSRMLFGDGGTATIIEKQKGTKQVRFGLKTDGNRFKSIIIPSGAYRNMDGSRELVQWEDGNIRSDYDLFMNGTEVFSFTMTDVPKLVTEFMEHYGNNSEDYDSFIFHQPNLFILKHLAKKIKVPLDKMPVSLDRYGNTSGCAIPITICDAFGGKKQDEKRLFLYGFGVGLSWGCADITMDADVCILPIEHTDDYYREGGLKHA